MDKTTCGVCGASKPECTPVLGQFMQIRAFISCVFILIQRSDWVGLDHLFLGSYVKSSHATVGGEKKKKKECLI